MCVCLLLATTFLAQTGTPRDPDPIAPPVTAVTPTADPAPPQPVAGKQPPGIRAPSPWKRRLDDAFNTTALVGGGLVGNGGASLHAGSWLMLAVGGVLAWNSQLAGPRTLA